MSTETSFLELIQGVRSGNPEAAAVLVRTHGEEVRTFIRQRLRHQRLRQIVDVSDIFQSVFAAFFVRVAAGQFDLDEPEQLTKLLVIMARNKIKDHARKAGNRRCRGVEAEMLDGLASSGPSPSEVVALQELYQRACNLLSDDERLLADLRTRGLSWAEIAATRSQTPDTLRKQLERAMDRVCKALGLETDDRD